MVRGILRTLLRGILYLFFRRIELAGLTSVPREGPLIFVTNHPNGLVDPLFLLCFAPRPVSFLAKAPLFRLPLIGALARALDAIPVYRRQDAGPGPRDNRETFVRARALLDRGGTIAVAPEGTSHSDPSLRPLKTGVARIALGAGTRDPIRIVPVGLFYTRKQIFRSEALVLFGPPFEVRPVVPGPDGEPPAGRVDELTAEIQAALTKVVVQADEHAALALAARAERILSAGPRDGRPSLAEVAALRQRLLRGYRTLRDRAPDELDRVRRQLDRLETQLAGVAVDPAHLAAERFSPGAITLGLLRFSARIGLFLPLALPGAIVHYPAYWLVGRLAERAVRAEDDVLATAKIIGAAILFPITWVLVGVAVGRAVSVPAGVFAAVLAPVAGYAALVLVERLERFASVTRAAGLYLLERETFLALAAERDRFRAELVRLAGQLDL